MPKRDIRERFIVQGMVCGAVLAALLVTTLVGLPFTERIRYIAANAIHADYTESLPFGAAIRETFERGRYLVFGELTELPAPTTSATPVTSAMPGAEPEGVPMLHISSEEQTAVRESGEVNTFYELPKAERLFIEDIIRQISEAEETHEPETYYPYYTDPPNYTDTHTLAPAIAPGSARITSPFGNRTNPITGQAEFHNGVDIALGHGTPVAAIQDGIITDIGYNSFSGHYIRYKTLDGLLVGYAHLYRSLVQVGDTVRQGDVVALSGNSGLSTGPHLHVSIWRDDELIDPLTIFAVQY